MTTNIVPYNSDVLRPVGTVLRISRLIKVTGSWSSGLITADDNEVSWTCKSKVTCRFRPCDCKWIPQLDGVRTKSIDVRVMINSRLWHRIPVPYNGRGYVLTILFTVRQNHMKRPLKRVTNVPHEGTFVSKRHGTCRSDDASLASTINLSTTVPGALDVRAFGLEDCAEAVISRGKESWTLANLSKWRQRTLDKAHNGSDFDSTPTLSNEFLRQRQRAYRRQCLASSTRDLANHLV